MRMRKFLAAGMALAILAATASQPIWADDGEDARRYGAREALTPELEDYRGGGCWTPGPVGMFLIIITLPVTLPILGIYLLGVGISDCVESVRPPDSTPPPTEPVPPPEAPAKKKECHPASRPIL